MKTAVKTEQFGRTPDSKPAKLYTIANENGMEIKITDYGCTVTSLKVPDRNANIDDVVLGYDTLQEYIKGQAYFIMRVQSFLLNPIFNFNMAGKRIKITTPLAIRFAMSIQRAR